MIPKDIFSMVKGKKVIITCINSGNGAHIEVKGVVESCSYNSYAGLFLKLDNGTIVNTRYIVTIEVQE